MKTINIDYIVLKLRFISLTFKAVIKPQLAIHILFLTTIPITSLFSSHTYFYFSLKVDNMWLVTAVVYKKGKFVSSFPYTIWVFSVKFKDYEWLHFYSGDSVEVCGRRSSFKNLSEKLTYATGTNPCLGDALGV